MKWGKIKEQIEAQGVTNETEVWLISTAGNYTNEWNLIVHLHLAGDAVSIYAEDAKPKENESSPTTIKLYDKSEPNKTIVWADETKMEDVVNKINNNPIDKF